MPRLLLLSLACIAATPAVVQAGMPSVHFVISEAGKLRLETLSFFLLVFFASAFGVQLLWNSLANDFTFLPRLTYGRALALSVLWGLMFVLVLTMISGARELMTPGAWERNGATYKLAPKTR